jgi:cellulose synthase operon protein C
VFEQTVHIGKRKQASKLTASAFALALVGVVISGCTAPEEKAKAYYESGQSYLEKKDFARAAIEFRNALKIKEDYADAWFGMAQVEENDRRWNIVAGNLNKVLELDPKHKKARGALARLMLLGGNPQEALKQAQLGLDQNPNDMDMRSLKAAVLLKMAKPTEAIEAANTVIADDPKNIDAIMVLAAERLNANDLAGSQKLIDTGISIAPNALSLHLFALGLSEKQGDVKKQEATLRKIIEIDPAQSGYRKALVAFLGNQKRFDDAERELRSIATANPEDVAANMDVVRFVASLPGKGPDAAIAELKGLIDSGKNATAYKSALAQLMFELKRPEDSFALLQQVIASEGITEPGINARLELAAKMIALKRFGEAEPLVTEVLANDARNVEALRQRAAILISKDDLEKAAADLREAQNQSPGNPGLEQMMAAINEKKGSIELADKNMSDAFRFSNYNPAIGMDFARFLVRRGQPDRAEGILGDLLESAPNNVNVLSMLADLKLRRQDWVGAQQLSETIKNVSSNKALASQITAAALAGQNKLEDGIQVLLKANSEDPSSVQTRFSLVRAYIKAKKFGEAEEYLKTLLLAEPQNAEARTLLGVVQFNAGQLDLAKLSFEAAIAMDPTKNIAYRALADFHLREGKPELAAQSLKNGLEKSPKDMDMRFALAALHERSGDVNSAINLYEEMLKDQPDSMIAANNYASLVSDFRTDAESLEKAARVANVLRGSPIAQFKDTLGWVLFLRGQHVEALELLKQSTADLPDMALTNYHLGRAYEANGDSTSAMASFERALKLATTDKERSLIETSINALKSKVSTTP